MTTDDILRMAREAGISNAFMPPQFSEVFERFAALVAAAERDECAKVCEVIAVDRWALYKGHKPYTGQELDRASDFTQGQSDGAELCEQAIRARGMR